MVTKAHHINILADFRVRLRDEIQRNMVERSHSQLSFSEIVDIHQAKISNIYRDKASIEIDELDRITEAFDLPYGAFYGLYLGECLLSYKQPGGHKWRVSEKRCSDFMVNCLMNDQREHFDELTCYLLDYEHDYLNIFFEVAERLYESGQWEKALPLYSQIVPHVRLSKSTSRYSAKSLFRLLEILTVHATEWTMAQKLEIVYKLEVFSENLPENYELDAYVALGKFYFNEERWDKLEFYGEKLWRISEMNKSFYLRNLGYNQTNPLGKRPLVFYYGYGWLMKGVSAQKTGRYEDALYCIDQYSDLSDFGLIRPHEVGEIQKFKQWAIGNRFTVKILSGDFSILREYLDYLLEHPEEILAGLVTIFESSHMDDSLLESVLAEFEDKVSVFATMTNSVELTWRYLFHSNRAKFYIRRESTYFAVEDLLAALQLASVLRSFEYYQSCISLLVGLKMDANQEEKYIKLIKEATNA